MRPHVIFNVFDHCRCHKWLLGGVHLHIIFCRRRHHRRSRRTFSPLSSSPQLPAPPSSLPKASACQCQGQSPAPPSASPFCPQIPFAPRRPPLRNCPGYLARVCTHVGIPATAKSFCQGYESRLVQNLSVIEDISGISSG